MYGLPSFVLRDIPQYCRVWQVVPFSLTIVKDDAFTSSSARRWAEIGEVARSAGGVRKYRPWRWQIQVSSPSAHRRWDRGSARRARGLKKTGEKGKIYPCAEMRITILIFSSYCIYVALPDISAPFFLEQWGIGVRLLKPLPCRVP